jgi:hypothetical protein
MEYQQPDIVVVPQKRHHMAHIYGVDPPEMV